jgi:molybdopterin-guanine dinucleotide biosynthesis protein A
MFYDVTGIILAGGDSRRMGRDKAMLRLSETAIIETTARLFKRLFSEVIIVSKQAGRFGDLRCREVEDIYPDKGAMIGILTGLKEAETDYIFTAACDMPFLNEKVINLIINSGRGYDVALPSAAGYTHPLHALYSRKCLDGMSAFMEKGEKGINRFIKNLPKNRVKTISEEEVKALDPDALSLFNVNTPEDMERAGRIFKKISS